MFNLQQAAEKAGISSALLHLWVATGKVTPALNMTVDATAVKDPIARKALQQWAHQDETVGWIFTDEDVEKLRSLVESTAKPRVKAESTHVKGSHYTVQELAALWGLGVDKIRELFENEPDVVKLKNPPKKGKRAYVTLRIPEAVAARVQRRNS